MTPDKVEAALGVLARIADDYHPDTDKEAPLALAEMREALTEALSVLTEALAEGGVSAPTPCLWIQDFDDGSWDTGCGDKHQFTEGDICDNGHHFCPYCGGRIFDTNEPTDDAAMKETP